jgi:hypothetical protein
MPKVGLSAAVLHPLQLAPKGAAQPMIVIGIDAHKRSHTAHALDRDEQPLGQLRVRADADQLARLLQWAAAWPQRTWAIEDAHNLAGCWPGSWSRRARRC